MVPLETNLQKGYLISLDVEDYGETSPFFIRDGVSEREVLERSSRSWMPSDYSYKRMKDFNWDLYDENVSIQKSIANSFIEKFKEFRREGRGLYIFSETRGSGKTLLACAMANEIINRNDISVKFISATEYIELCKDKSEFSRNKIDELLNAPLLILDDIGSGQYEKEWVSSVLFRLINRRHEDLLPTIFTSNLETDDLKCDSRISDRIYEDSIPLKMPEKSIRRKKADKSISEFLERVVSDCEKK